MGQRVQISVASLLKIVNCVFVTSSFNFLEVKLRFLSNMRWTKVCIAIKLNAFGIVTVTMSLLTMSLLAAAAIIGIKMTFDGQNRVTCIRYVI